MSEDESYNEFLLAETWAEVKKDFKRDKHGHSFCKFNGARAFKVTGIKVVTAPPVHLGMRLHHISFSGTISLKP